MGNEDEKNAMLAVDNAVCKRMRGCTEFEGVENFSTNFVLGYVGVMRMPLGSEVSWHKDPTNECDLAAVFVFQGGSDVCVGVKNTTHFIARGDMYIFQPTQEYHSVGAPSGTDAEERCAIALRYYRKDRPDAAQDLVWSPAVLDKEDLRVRQNTHFIS